jgi:beta-mannosidase
MKRIDLAGTWNLQAIDDGEIIAAAVPGDTHSALLAAGKIADPYWGANELDLQELARRDWLYSREFDIDESFLQEKAIFLNCDSLDTICEIRINDQPVGTSENMFVRHRFDLKQILHPGRNRLEIQFKSAELAAAAANQALPYPIPHGQNPVQSQHRNLVRKVQCHSGWDWGCCLMVAGINGDIYLGASSTARIEYVTTTQHHSPNHCRVQVFCEVDSPSGGECPFEVSLAKQRIQQTVQLQPGRNNLTADVEIPSPRLWWPNGHGDQHLYELKVRVGDDSTAKRLGLRNLEVVSKDDSIGRSLKFRVNGIDIFCKGANWIPSDALPQRQTRARLENLISAAAAANMNMLRVWGGGQYEQDAFYELCDEKGLLIWHDFMFACSLYPATPAFLENVRREATHQVKRLRDHACLALWCGNNENITALKWYEESRANRDRYLVDYDRLNEGVLGDTVASCDPTRTFWPSSPCGGPQDYSDCMHDDTRGDMHYWDVWHGGKPFEAFFEVTPRFCSEFGYQSFPSLETIRSYAPESEFNVTAPIMEHHQRNRGGNSKIIEMFSRYFRMPNGFGNFVYLSQVQQALAIKTGVEYWRHLSPACMGTLYWQLNDNWPVCSWASIEYSGKWKLLHYLARRFYAPTIAAAFQKDDNLEVCVVTDRLEPQTLSLCAEIVDFQGNSLKREVFDVQTGGAGNVTVFKRPVAELVNEPTRAFMELTLTDEHGEFRNTHFFCKYKQCELPLADIQTRVEQQANGTFAITLSSDAPAFFTSLDANSIRGEFDDNCVTLLPNQSRRLLFTPKTPEVTLEQFRAALSLNHLRGSY